MRGYALPIVLALLLATPMLWRLDGDVPELQGPSLPSATAKLVIDQLPSDLDAAATALDGRVHFSFVPLLPAAQTSETDGLWADRFEPVLLPLPERGD